MNNLTKEIVLHILNNFGITEQKSFNLLDLNNKANIIEFIDYNIDVYSISNFFQNTNINILGMNLSLDSKEYIVYFKVDGTPDYAIYYSENKSEIYCFMNHSWIECNTYMKAMVLAGIEQLKYINTNWKLYIDNQEELNKIKQLILLIDGE